MRGPVRKRRVRNRAEDGDPHGAPSRSLVPEGSECGAPPVWARQPRRVDAARQVGALLLMPRQTEQFAFED
ncbi:MAG: hypothetical protein NVS3B26_09970 [Mycobacteriales bacterium]